MVNLKELIQKRKNQIVGIRRELHQIPEPAYTEQKTSAAVADHLKKAGLEVRTGVARYGVVGLLRTEKPGPTLMIRADMDALPVTEQTGLPISSAHAGAMPACGGPWPRIDWIFPCEVLCLCLFGRAHPEMGISGWTLAYSKEVDRT
jgi:amidohydrolase